MKRPWIVAVAVLSLAGCKQDRGREAMGVERSPQQGATGAPGAPSPEGRAGVPEREQSAVARLLGTLQVDTRNGLEAARAAQQKASAPEVKSFATRLVSQYQQDMDAISRLTGDKKIDINAVTGQDPVLQAQQAAKREEVQNLNSLSGADFDAAFLRSQPSALTMRAQLAEQGRKVTKDPDLDGFFSKIATQARDDHTEVTRLMPAATGGAKGGATGQPGGATGQPGGATGHPGTTGQPGGATGQPPR